MGDGQVLVVEPRRKKTEGVSKYTFLTPPKEDCSFWKADLLPVLDSVIPQSTDGGGGSFWSFPVDVLSRPTILEKRCWKEAGRVCLAVKDSCKQETLFLLQE